MKVYLYYRNVYEGIFDIYSEEGIKELKEKVLLPQAHQMRDKIVGSFSLNISEYTKRRQLYIEKEQKLLKESRNFDKHSTEYKEAKKERKNLLKTIGHYNELIKTSKDRIEAVNFSNDEDLIAWYLRFTRQEVEVRDVLNNA